MFKEFLLKQMLKRKLGSLPADKQKQVTDALARDPDLFMAIAGEIQAEMKAGKSEMQAAMEVMKRHEDKLKGLFG